MECLVCGESAEVGTLCRRCAGQVVPCDGMIREHIRSNVLATDADAWLVDGFGAAHAVCERSTIGRAQEGDVVVLAASVSREHAELRQSDGAWALRDLGSRNGTFVDGARIQGRVTLPTRGVVKIGDVLFWFLSEVVETPAPPATMETVDVGDRLVRYTMTCPPSADAPSTELCLVGGGETTTGGALMVRAVGTAAWKEHALAPLEFQLLRALCTRAHAEASSPAATRGCVPTKQLVRDLPWQSRYANDENVRQVVRRLRGALAEAGAEGIVNVVPGRGYYLSVPVTVAAR